MNPLPSLILSFMLLAASAARAQDLNGGISKFKVDKSKWAEAGKSSVFAPDQDLAGAALDDQAKAIKGSGLSPAGQATQMKDVDGRRGNIASCDAGVAFISASIQPRKAETRV